MPKQSRKKCEAEAHTPYSRSYEEGSSSSKTDNSNILGISDASDKDLSAAVILLHLSTEAAEQEAIGYFANSDTEAYSPQEASNNRQESSVKDEVDSEATEETHRQPGDPDGTILEYAIPVRDRSRPGHRASFTEAIGYQIQEFP